MAFSGNFSLHQTRIESRVFSQFAHRLKIPDQAIATSLGAGPWISCRNASRSLRQLGAFGDPMDRSTFMCEPHLGQIVQTQASVLDGFVELLQEALEYGDISIDRLGSVIADHQRLAHGFEFLLHGVPPPT